MIFVGIIAALSGSAYLLLRDKKFYSVTGIPISAENQIWVGRWMGEGLTITIPKFGNVHYERKRDGYNTDIDLPMQAISLSSIKLGFAYWSTDIAVEAIPHLVGDKWKMTIDNIELTRQD